VVVISKTVTIRGGYNADFFVRDPDTYSVTLDAEGQGWVLYDFDGEERPVRERVDLGAGEFLDAAPEEREIYLPLIMRQYQ
jgi:hypothetical protein